MNLVGFTVCLIILKVVDPALRIFWGQNADFKRHPYIAALMYLRNKTNKKMYICTCTILKPTWTLTAAHCVKRNLKLIIGYGPDFPSGGFSYSNVTGERIHPSYLTNINKLFKNDIALLQTAPIVLEQYGKLSALDSATLVGHAARVFGFGIMNDGDKVGHVAELGTALQVADVVIKKCIKSANLCLSPKCREMTTLCPGDSGGPVIHQSGVVGVNSFGALNLCTPKHNINKLLTVDFILGFIPVCRYIDWISDIIKNNTKKK